MAKQLNFDEAWDGSFSQGFYRSQKKDSWQTAFNNREKVEQKMKTTEDWKKSGKPFFDFMKIGDSVAPDELIMDLTFGIHNRDGDMISVNILAYRCTEERLEPLRAVFQLNNVLGQSELKGYRAESGKIFTTYDDLVSPKEAIEQGLLDDEEMEQLKSFGSSEPHPMMTMEVWKKLQEERMFISFIFVTSIGGHFNQDFVAYISGQNNPRGEVIGKEEEGCIASEKKDEFVAAKPVFKELSAGEWELVGYFAEGKVYGTENPIMELGYQGEKPSEFWKEYEKASAQCEGLESSNRQVPRKSSSSGELQALNLW